MHVSSSACNASACVYLPQHNVLYIVDIMGRRALQHVCLGQEAERLYSEMWIAIKTFLLRYNRQVLKYTYEEVYIINGRKKKCIEATKWNER